MLLPESGSAIEPATDGNVLLLADPLTPQLFEKIGSVYSSIIEMWALWRQEVGDLRLLQRLKGLQRLHIINRTSADLRELAHLRHLRVLTVESDNIFDLELTSWPCIEELGIPWSKTLELAAETETLRTLRVIGWKAVDLATLKAFPHARVLEILGGNLHTLSGLEYCSELEHLSLSRNTQLSNFSAIRSLSKLRTLKIDTCKRFSSVDVLATLPNLETLYLDNLGSIDSLSPLSNSPQLKNLYFTESTNIIDGDTDIVNRMKLKAFGFQNRRHYNFKYDHLRTREERSASEVYKNGAVS